MLHNAHPKRKNGSAKRGEASEAKSGNPINVVHMTSTFAPSLITAIIFRRIGKKNWSRFRVVLTKEMQGGNINAFKPQSD